MRRCERDGLCWLEFELLRGLVGVRHAIFLRQGGVSVAPYQGLNCSTYVGDNPRHVAHNRLRAQALLGASRLAHCRHVHGTTMAVVGTKRLPEQLCADGLSTKRRGVALMTTYADCQCALFYDPVRRVAANVHAGWRGSVANVYAKAVEHLRRRYGCRPRDLLVGISPSLSPQRAEFIHYQRELPESFWPFQVSSQHFDFWAISRHQLEACGILPHHIEIAQLCTYDQVADCFSYRREKVTGRHGAFIALF